MSDVQDRPYQREFVNGSDEQAGVFPAWQDGHDAVLGLLPTGAGKTVCAGLVATKARDDLGRRTLFLAHREELINQAARTLGNMGLSTAIEMGAQKADSSVALFGKADVIIATVQTLQGSRLLKRSKSEFGVIITDESHHARALSYRRIYDHFDDYYHLGITATPDRGDGKNLGAIYSKVAYRYSLRSAISDGWLVPIVATHMPCGINLRDIRTTGGDYNQADLEERIGPHIEALCDIVRQEIGTRQTVIFTPDVGSAEACADALTQMGVSAQAVSGKMSKEERKAALDDYQNFGYQVICCCELLIEGWDCKPVSCVVVMRPTKSRARYTQMIGRGTRPYGNGDEKSDVLVIDFAWETTQDHELCTTVDLFDDSDADKETMKIAAGLVASGAERDPMKAIDEAERIISDRTAFKIRLTGKRTQYRKVVYDPVGVGSIIGVSIKKGWDFKPDNPASRAQLDALSRMGVERPEGISKSGAGKMISALKKRNEANLATIKQVEYMISLGVEVKQARQMTFDDATKALNQLTPRRAG